MEGLAIGFLIKALVSQSKLARPLLVSVPILIILALPQVETLMATLIVWLAPARGILEKPAFAFLLVNCVIVTIIASSKLGSEKRGHEEESEGAETMGQINGNGDEKGDLVPGIVVGGKSGYDYPYGEHSLRRSLSLTARYKDKTKQEQAKLKYVIERKSSRKVRLASIRNDKVGLSHPNKPFRNDLKKKHMNRGSLSIHSEAGSPQYEKPTPQNWFDTTTADCLVSRPLECPSDAAATATDHPSLEEVWAAIMASNKTDHCTACKPQAELTRSIHEADSKTFNRPQPAAATGAPTPPLAAVALDPPPAVLMHSSWLPAALAPAHPARGAAKDAPNPRAGMPSKPHTAAAEKHVEDGNDAQKNNRELEELNRRAEEFIARFNRQIRLQREESLQCQKKGPRPCNYDVQYPEHPFALRVPARGLLVG